VLRSTAPEEERLSSVFVAGAPSRTSVCRFMLTILSPLGLQFLAGHPTVPVIFDQPKVGVHIERVTGL